MVSEQLRSKTDEMEEKSMKIEEDFRYLKKEWRTVKKQLDRLIELQNEALRRFVTPRRINNGEMHLAGSSTERGPVENKE
ncbi:hypothetical protein L6452_23719 [Arctium lappa]|uniref:Uncharacterized protein n=1 Tax=Arctium lappa TaxID=4217 RepID=A0ACB9B2T8_ARCLA|nr:hypothetical protein L6452_23719 [Arctium lappa]